MTTAHNRSLAEAIVHKDAKGALAALERGADPNARIGGARALHLATITGSSEMVRLLTKAGALPDAQDKVGRSALHYAAMGSPDGDPDLVQALLSAGAEVNIADSIGCTPLDMAAGLENEEAARALVQAGGTCRADRRSWVQRVRAGTAAKAGAERSPGP
jgi:ankyrin repeat protein